MVSLRSFCIANGSFVSSRAGVMGSGPVPTPRVTDARAARVPPWRQGRCARVRHARRRLAGRGAGLLVALATTWAVFARGANAVEITISAGDQARPAGPVSWAPATRLDAQQAYFLVAENEKPVPAQLDEQGRLWWWAAPMDAGQSRTYRIETRPAAEAKPRVTFEREGGDRINVLIDGKLFTSFHFGKDVPKPFLYPVIGPTGRPVTRDYPLKDNPIEKAPAPGAKTRQDHPHHRSIWTAHGDVRMGDFSRPGSNYWNEVAEKGTAEAGARIVKPENNDCEKVKSVGRTGGAVFGRIVAEIEWVNKAGRRELTEERTYTFFAGDDSTRIIDQKSVYRFPDGDVMFADTKEGGLVSVRMAVTMDEIGAAGRHGQMCNSNGQVGEKQCWGKPADWCDYVGPVDGDTLGIAIMDAPGNFRHPEPWHIRGYGLFTANPFGLKEFTGDKTRDGSKVWKKGETAEFNYRILIHKGDTKAARVAEAYSLFADPPKVAAKQAGISPRRPSAATEHGRAGGRHAER
ncbi:MAG TPA: PmoA family protein, partial [Phycisphaerae bacterium]|nr:PmoA family protein [Phycisphaerae bacterium]